MKTLAIAMEAAFNRYRETETPEALNVATEIVRSFLDDTVNDIFIQCQERLGIESGDADPWDVYSLSDSIRQTADTIVDILTTQAELYK